MTRRSPPFLTLARRALLAVLALVLWSGSALAHARYFYCEAMEQVRARPCCAREAPPVTDTIVADCACCHSRSVGALPPATHPQVPQSVVRALPARAHAYELAPIRPSIRVALTKPWAWAPPPRPPPRSRTTVLLL